MIKVVRRLIVVVMVVLLAAIAFIAVTDYKEFSGHENAITEQRAHYAEAQEGKAELKRRIKEVGAEMEALPDSVQLQRMGDVMRESWSMAKREQQLDGKQERATNLIRSYQKKQSVVLQHAMKWGLSLGIVTVLLGVTLLILRRSTA